mgnify:CR=1 FL=1
MDMVKLQAEYNRTEQLQIALENIIWKLTRKEVHGDKIVWAKIDIKDAVIREAMEVLGLTTL